MTLKRILGCVVLLAYGFIVFLSCSLLGAAISVLSTQPWWYTVLGTIFGTIAVVLHYIVKLEMEDRKNAD